MTALKVEIPAAEWTRLARHRRELLAALKAMVGAYDSDDGLGPIPIIEQAKAAIVAASAIRIVDGENKGEIVPLAEFLAVNEFDAAERAAIVDAVIAERVHGGGGGASRAWRIEPAEFVTHLAPAG